MQNIVTTKHGLPMY